jgi:hypothetical protein
LYREYQEAMAVQEAAKRLRQQRQNDVS